MVTLQLTATLKDINGNPLSGKPINFYYSYDQQTWNLIATVNTDVNGVATTTHETTQSTYYKAVFEGDDEYEPSEATASYTLEVHFTITSYPTSINTHPNETININVTVLNDGNAEGTCEVRLRDHNNVIVDSKQVAIAQGAEETVALQATAPSTEGTYTWTVEVYNLNTQTVDDSKSITVNVIEVIENPHFTITSYPNTINTRPNYTIGFNVTVLNDGNADGTCEVRLKDHNNNIVDSEQVAIAQGEEKSVALQATAPSQVGTYTWTIEAYNVDTQTVDDSKSITINVTEVSYYRKRILAVMWNNTLQLHELE